MKKYFIIGIVVLAFLAVTMPAGAETVFNQMSSCIKTWDKCCKPCGGTQAQATTPRATMTTDTLGNKIPANTDNSGKTLLGR